MIKWTNRLSYAIGLLTADGNLSPDGRHIAFVSKDIDLVNVFKTCLGLNNKISIKSSGYCKKRNNKYYFVQFGDVQLYKFLQKIGLNPNKSKTIKKLLIPRKYFPDFLRRLIDGDGHIHFFKHPESRFLQLNLRVISGSRNFLTWLKRAIYNYFRAIGRIREVTRAYELNYYKSDSKELLRKIYRNKGRFYLKRKFKTASLFFSEGGGIGRRASLRS